MGRNRFRGGNARKVRSTRDEVHWISTKYEVRGTRGWELGDSEEPGLGAKHFEGAKGVEGKKGLGGVGDCLRLSSPVGCCRIEAAGGVATIGCTHTPMKVAGTIHY